MGSHHEGDIMKNIFYQIRCQENPYFCIKFNSEEEMNNGLISLTNYNPYKEVGLINFYPYNFEREEEIIKEPLKLEFEDVIRKSYSIYVGVCGGPSFEMRVTLPIEFEKYKDKRFKFTAEEILE